MNSGFELIGFDLAAYSNKDTSKKEVRLELGLKLARGKNPQKTGQWTLNR